MAYSEADKRFAARCCGTTMERVRKQLRDPSELGYVQLIAAAVPLVTGFMKKKKAKKNRKRAEAMERMQATLQPSIGASIAAEPAPAPVPSPASFSRMAVPLGIAAGVLVLAVALRK